MPTTPGPCPKCGSSRTRQVGETLSPPSVAQRCDGCGHMWVTDVVPRAREASLPESCPSCGGTALRNVGASNLAARYLRCESCNRLVIVPPR
jgi:transposase-like protein